MNKTLSVILVLIIVALTLTACGGGSSYSSSGGSSSRTCQYKENGKRVCSRSADSGNFCSYHQGYLDSIYEGLVGN